VVHETTHASNVSKTAPMTCIDYHELRLFFSDEARLEIPHRGGSSAAYQRFCNVVHEMRHASDASVAITASRHAYSNPGPFLPGEIQLRVHELATK